MILILVLLLGLGWNATLLAQTPFFQGKTITIAVGDVILVIEIPIPNRASCYLLGVRI